MSSAVGRSVKILFVEDDSFLRKMVTGALRREGYRVIEASNGQEGIDAFRADSGSIDLIISDIVMPEISGPEMIRAICSHAYGKAIRVLFTSGYPEDRVTENVSLLMGFLDKPFNTAALIEKIRSMLKK